MYLDGIKAGLKQGLRNEVICRKIYTVYPAFVFDNDLDRQFEIYNAISNEFKVPITSIQMVGSAKTGYSYVKDKAFNKGESDLDIAIVDAYLFQKYSEIVIKETAGFTDLSNFKNIDQYSRYIMKGVFRPDLMPSCEVRKRWFNFFNKLSSKHIDLFSDINAGIYFSQTFFEFKQTENIEIIKRAFL